MDTEYKIKDFTIYEIKSLKNEITLLEIGDIKKPIYNIVTFNKPTWDKPAKLTKKERKALKKLEREKHNDTININGEIYKNFTRCSECGSLTYCLFNHSEKRNICLDCDDYIKRLSMRYDYRGVYYD